MEINLELPKLVLFRSHDTRKMFVDKFNFLECISDTNDVTPETAIIVDDRVTEAYVDMGKQKGVLVVNSMMFPDIMIKLRTFIDNYKLNSDVKMAANALIESLLQETKETA